MRSFDRLPVQLIRILFAAAISAALFVPWLSASAQEGCPPGGCPLPPPQSREVNPSPTRADGSAVEVPRAAELPPVEITVHVLAPPFVDPAPFGIPFETIPVGVRYQSPDDATCGVQALGMALDALPGAAPTSVSMLGFLQDRGMFYDYGTGVEELAYAAQSFGYKGSFSFHGASMGQLQAQLAAGSPVVVSLSANGEAAPGHFVTVTGVSPDGQWVTYNDPTLGKQVISASEFERLWGMQGNSGVVVAKDPPPEAGDPDVLALWAAFAAGLMALVSTTPLGKFRQGIGGRLDSGGGGRSAPAPKPERRSDPPEKEKEDKPAKPKARFDEEVVPPAPAPKATKARFDAEIAVAPTPPKATKPRFDKEPPPPPKPKPTPKPRFDDEALPPARPTPRLTAAPVATPSEQRAARATATPGPGGGRAASHGSVYSPTAATQGAPRYAGTASPGALIGGDRLVALPPLPDKYLKYLPTATLPEWDERTLYVPLGILEVGMHDAFHAGVPANDNLRLTPTRSAFTIGNTSVKVGWGGSSIEVAARTPRKEFSVISTGATMAVGQSGSLSVTWDGWNTISKAAYNPVDYTVSGPDDREVAYGSGIHGVYVEQKPVQELAATALGAVALGATLVAYTLFGPLAPWERILSNPLRLYE